MINDVWIAMQGADVGEEISSVLYFERRRGIIKFQGKERGEFEP